MTPYEPNIWTTIAGYCRELAPISGNFLDAIAQTALAIDRAGEQTHSYRSVLDQDHRPMFPPEDAGEEC